MLPLKNSSEKSNTTVTLEQSHMVLAAIFNIQSKKNIDIWFLGEKTLLSLRINVRFPQKESQILHQILNFFA